MDKIVCPNCENTGAFIVRVDNDWEEIAEERKLANEVAKEGIKDDTGSYYGGYSKNGKMSNETVVPKELLNEAADLLEMYIMFESKVSK